MKLRKGFVSNSSTTSFTCDACGEIIAYHDSCDYEDLGIVTYECGHETCSCIDIDFDDEDVRKKWRAGAERAIREEIDGLKDQSDIPEQYRRSDEDVTKKIELLNSILALEDFEEFRSEFKACSYSWRSFNPKELCPICSLEALNNDYLFDYLIAKFQFNLKEVHDEIKSKFKNFAEFKEWVKSQKESIK